MTNPPLVSIIIPTYNRAHLIGETLDSVLAQTYTNWECIVVDDGSTDNTDQLMADYCAKDARFQYHHRPADRLPGGNAARNYGFEMSKGEYVNWFDSDDIMLPDKINSQLYLFQIDTDFVGCKGAELKANKLGVQEVWNFELEGNLALNHIRGRISFGTNGLLFKKQFLVGKKLFNEELLIRQEWEFFSRLLIGKPNIVIFNKVLYYYSTLENGIRKKVDLNKTKSKMKAERLILIEVKKVKPFNLEEDYIFSRDLYFKFLKYTKNSKNIKILIYPLFTFFKSLSIKKFIFILSKLNAK